MAFRGLTKKGADYLATRLANELAVEFLKVEIGDGAIVSGQNPKNQTSLISYKKDVRILKKEQENNAINLTIQITNDDITQGFYLKEIGIYVNDSSSNGCLYWYCNEDNAQYIPAKTDSVIAFEIDIRMEVTNSDATIINWSGKNTWINKEYLEENYTQNGGYKGTSQEINDRLNSALGKHDGDFPVANAVVGNVYYSAVTKKYYKCKIGGPAPVPNGNFIDLSILENLNRLENLFTIHRLRIRFKDTDISNNRIAINTNNFGTYYQIESSFKFNDPQFRNIDFNKVLCWGVEESPGRNEYILVYPVEKYVVVGAMYNQIVNSSDYWIDIRIIQAN